MKLQTYKVKNKRKMNMIQKLMRLVQAINYQISHTGYARNT